MATRRKANPATSDRSTDDTKLQSAKKRKLKSHLPKEGTGTLKWMLLFFLLAAAVLIIAYCVVYYGSLKVAKNVPAGATNSSSETDKESRSSSKPKGAGSTAKSAEPKQTNKKRKQKKDNTSNKKSKSSSSGSKSKPSSMGSNDFKMPRRKDKYVNMSNLNLAQIPVLQWPVPPADPDRPFIIEILTGDKALSRRKYKEALTTFEEILKRFPQSPRAMFGKAETLCKYSEAKRSNKYLDLCIDAYWVVAFENVVANAEIKEVALLRLAERASFRGKMQTATKAWVELSRLLPKNHHYARQVGTQWLLAGKHKLAKEQFRSVLNRWPDDTFAKAQLGTLLKMEGNIEDALPLLLDGLRNNEEVRKSSEFYFHTGECLAQMGRNEEAHLLYAEAVALGHFPSVWQHPLQSTAGLRAQPWWLVQETRCQEFVAVLTDKWKDIRSEAKSALGSFQVASEVPGESGELTELPLYSGAAERGCEVLPQTCELIAAMATADVSCRIREVKLLSMVPGTHMWPRSAVTNNYLTFHLGLATPTNSLLSVANETRSWSEGKMLIFDGSFEHELWNRGQSNWLVLDMKTVHPDLKNEQQNRVVLTSQSTKQ